MKLLPYESFCIISNYKPDDILSKMNEVIFVRDAERAINSGYDFYSTKYFVGTVSKNGFNVQPDITYRNSFLPNIKGEVKGYNEGSKIQIKMVIAPGMAAFIFACSLFVSIATITNTVSYWTLIIVFLFLYLVIMVAFKSESKKAINILLDIFEGEIAT